MTRLRCTLARAVENPETFRTPQSSDTTHAGGSGADTRTLSCARLYRGGVVYDGPRPRPQSSETTFDSVNGSRALTTGAARPSNINLCTQTREKKRSPQAGSCYYQIIITCLCLTNCEVAKQASYARYTWVQKLTNTKSQIQHRNKMFAIPQYVVKLVIKPRIFSPVARQPALTWSWQFVPK